MVKFKFNWAILNFPVGNIVQVEPQLQGFMTVSVSIRAMVRMLILLASSILGGRRTKELEDNEC